MYCYTKDALVPVKGRMVFLGDSITDYGHYISLIHTHLLINRLDQDVQLFNVGVSCETVSGLSEAGLPFPRPCILRRLDRVLELLRPDWVVACYGMNDGIYQPLSEERFSAYRRGIGLLIERVQRSGARIVLVTPPPYDRLSDQDGRESAYAEYDGVLAMYGEWLMSEASKTADKVIDIRPLVVEHIRVSRGERPDYTYGDGVHPDLQGHCRIARGLLRELFGFHLEGLADTMPLFEAVYRADTLRHLFYKEAVGHEHPDKADVSQDAMEKEQDAMQKTVEEWLKGDGRRERRGEYGGFERLDFCFEGYEAILVKPKTMAPGCRWIWRTEYFDAFAWADKAMLREGYALLHLRIPHLFGNPVAVDIMDRFYRHVTERFRLNERATLFGFSRGGLYAMGYAEAYPGHIASLYLDAPVVDIRSWPGGMGAGCGSEEQWSRCRLAYGMNAETGDAWETVMDRRVRGLIASEIPVIMVYGDEDDVVPYEENGLRIEQAMQGTGVPHRIIRKQGVGHHPHSLEDPEPIVRFLCEQEAGRG